MRIASSRYAFSPATAAAFAVGVLVCLAPAGSAAAVDTLVITYPGKLTVRGSRVMTSRPTRTCAAVVMTSQPRERRPAPLTRSRPSYFVQYTQSGRTSVSAPMVVNSCRCSSP